MPRVAVVTDSAASLPAHLIEAWDITVVPLHVAIDGVERVEDEHTDASTITAALEAGQRVTTSHPSPEAFAQAFRAQAQAGADAVVAVLLSSGISATVQSAAAGTKGVGIDVHVVDSRSVAMGTGFAALAAAVAARRGGSPHEVVQAATRCADGARVYFTVDTLEYLRKGGRLSGAAAAMGTMLQVRPVMTLEGGRVAVAHKVRTTAKAHQAVVDAAVTHAHTLSRPGVAVHTMTAQTPELVASGLGALPRLDVSMSAVLSAHTGPGVLAVVAADLPDGFSL